MLTHPRENKIIHVPNHCHLKDGNVLCRFCGDKNLHGNPVRLPLMLVTEPHAIYVAFTRSGKHAHGLHTDLKTALGAWVVFASGEVLEKALVYLGMTPEQLEHHKDGMKRWDREPAS